MDAHFWLQRWEKNELNFHEPVFNHMMVKHFPKVPVSKNPRVFVPLCGKTLDMHWLLSQGYQVIGCELSELAIKQLFDELKLKPTITQNGPFTHFSAENIEIFVGDIFELSAKQVGQIDVIYDRGALVALPLDMRSQYSAHITTLTNTASQFLLVFEYDIQKYTGSPFAIFKDDLQQYYDKDYSLTQIDKAIYSKGLRGFKEVEECAWILTPK